MRKKEYYSKAAPVTPFMKMNEAMKFLGLTYRALKGMAERGEVPCRIAKNGKSNRNTYLFPRQELERWANSSN